MWTLLVVKIFGSALLIFASALISDWIFSGSKWAQKYFSRVPEIWRTMETGENKIIRTSLLMTITYSVAFVLFYFIMRPGLIFTSPLTHGIAIGTFLWVLVPLPHLVTQHLYIKYHPAITRMQLAGWYMKLVSASLIMTFLF